MGSFGLAGELIKKGIEWIKNHLDDMIIDDGPRDSTIYLDNIQVRVNIDKVLTDFQEALTPKAEELEKTCIGEVLKQFDQYIAGQKAEYPELVDALKKKRNHVQNKLAGTIMNHVSKRASTNDEELKSILEMQPGSEKTQRLKEQSDKFLKEAVDRFKKRLKEEMDGLNKELSERFNKALNEQEDELQKKEEDYLQLLDEVAYGQLDLNNLEEDVLLVSNACFCMEYLFAQMEKEER